MTDAIVIRVAAPEHAPAIAALVREAFRVQADLYSDPNLPPMSESAESVLKAMSSGIVLEALDPDGNVVGTVRGELQGDSCYVARLAVSPGLQGMGVGRLLMLTLEEHFPKVEGFKMFTGHRSKGPLHLYESLGYKRVAEEPVNELLHLVYLEKHDQ